MNPVLRGTWKTVASVNVRERVAGAIMMKRLWIWVLLAAAMVTLSGCTSYQYRIIQPASSASVVGAQPVRIHDDPLDYTLSRQHNRLAMRITNPTDERVVLQGVRSYVIDPQGESHPIRDRAIGPHSFTQMLLPPVPFTFPYPDYYAYGPGWGWGYIGSWYDPLWGPGLGWWGPPPVTYHRILTVYDWEWQTGPVRLRLVYDRNGKTFEHEFEFLKERK